MSDAAIHLENLGVRAGRRTILSVDMLKVRRGEFLGVLGPNGAGKTTLLRCCLGMMRGYSGQVRVFGREVRSLSSHGLAMLRRRIGYVPQLLPARTEMPLTVREVIAIGRTGIAGLLRPLGREDWRIVDKWIERLGLSELAGRGYGVISGGEQRKTLIARAMVQQPDLLLLDEPTANLDLGWRERIVGLVDRLYRTAAVTVVLVCHELEVLPAGCRRVAVLDAGRLHAGGKPEQVFTPEIIEGLYGPGLTVIHNAGRLAVVPGEVVDA